MNVPKRFWPWLLTGACAFTWAVTTVAQTPSAPVRSGQALSVRSKVEVDNIARLLDALRACAESNQGKYPSRLDELTKRNILSEDEFKRFSTSPLAPNGASGEGYVYHAEGKGLQSAPTEVLLMGRNPLGPSDPRRAVGLQDGSVVWWKRAQIEAFMKAAKNAR